MVLSKGNVRILVNIPTELNERVEEATRKEHRSTSNYIIHLIQKELEATDKKMKNSKKDGLVQNYLFSFLL